MRPSVLALFALILLIFAQPLRAQILLRDAEIEYALRELATPVIRASGLPTGSIRILVIKDPSLNAYILDTQHIFIHSGLFLKLKSAEELQSVIAHEVAHIANGHISRRITNTRSAGNAAAMGLLLSLAVAAGGGNGEAAAGVAIGTASAAQRALLAHTRAEESSADQSAVRYLASAGVEPTAMLDVLNLFRGQEALNSARQDPYARSHPMSRDRIRGLTGFAAAYKGRGKANPTRDYWFARAQGKLSAFLRNPPGRCGG